MGEFQSDYLDELRRGQLYPHETSDAAGDAEAAPGTLTVELRPPASDRSGSETMDAWIDTYHSVRQLVRKKRFLFLTDNAVGAAEEENLAHLGSNLAEEVDPSWIAPFLTCKHSLDHCLMYAERA